MPRFQDQLARIYRLLKRIETHNRPPADYDDDMWAFFQNCWHLKDWIKNDPAVPTSVGEAVDTDVHASPELLVCADLANASKHLFLTTPKVGAKHSHKNYRIVVGWESRVEYFIDVGNGSKIDAVQLAQQCVKAWEAILKKHQLPCDV